MPNDHFIAQTYLRHFGDPSKAGMLHAYQKSTGKYFPCRPKNVCREWDGDLNPLLTKQGLLGDFRKLFEPHWNAAVTALRSSTLPDGDKFAISGYFANLMVCTPTWRRIGVAVYNDHAKSFLSFSKRMAEKHGGNPNLPIEAITMLERGELTLEHDPDYIKAITSQALLRYAWLTYHQDWVVIRNATAHPFITSDNPVAIRPSDNPQVAVIRYLPITPEFCLAVYYDRVNVPPFAPPMPPLGTVRWVGITDQDAKSINRLVAQCGEDLVFSSTASTGIEALVKNCARFRVEAEFVRLPSKEPDTVYEGSVIRVRETSRPTAASGS